MCVNPTGNVSGNANIDGGTSTNTTTVDLSANGGRATSNAQDGDDNVAVAGQELLLIQEAPVPILTNEEANTGNGGTATAEANGGTIEVGDVNSGDNTGNVIQVGL